VNDKSINLLEQYDLTINNISKGRGTLICDTNNGKYIFQEYNGKPEKLELIIRMQERFCDNLKTDTLIRTSQGELFVKDSTDNTTYILKHHLEGKECSYRSEEDIIKACGAMARMHLRLMTPLIYDEDTPRHEMPVYFFADEMERHTLECKRVYNYLKKRTRKNDFERVLLNEYNYFLEKAIDVTKRAKEESKAEYEAYVRCNRLYCHGDYQYHNVIFGRNEEGAYTGIVNMEHLSQDAGVKDFYLLFRKVCQKYDWSIDMALTMLEAYQNRRVIPPIELRSLKLMLEYPEKFWKIIDRYYNSKKSWMPDRNSENLDKLLSQEKNKEKLINKLF
jgi:CotS family spore coat protein